MAGKDFASYVRPAVEDTAKPQKRSPKDETIVSRMATDSKRVQPRKKAGVLQEEGATRAWQRKYRSGDGSSPALRSSRRAD